MPSRCLLPAAGEEELAKLLSGSQVRDGSLRPDLSLHEHVPPRRHLERQLDALLDHQDGVPAAREGVDDDLEDLGCNLWCKVGGRLVEDQYPRAPHQGSGDAEQLALPAAERCSAAASDLNDVVLRAHAPARAGRSPMMQQDPQSFDVAVAGGGMSGLVAACAAREAGATVGLFEKGNDLGGSLLMSNGFVVTYDDPDTLSGAVPEGDARLQATVVRAFGEACRWLGAMGVRMSPCRRVGGRSGYHVDPGEVVAVLRRRLEEGGATVDLGQPLRSLVRDGGRVVGLELAGRDHTRCAAAAVVLATGGFQGNPELLARLCGLQADGLYHRSNRWSTGDGLLAALEAGAATSPLTGGFYGHAMAAEPATVGEDTYAAATQYQGCDSVALNLAGRRFADESAGTGEEVLNQGLARQRAQLGFYVGDEQVACLEAPSGSGTTVHQILARTESLGGVVHRSPTLASLCEMLTATGADGRAALETLRDYRHAMREGTSPSGIGRGARRHRLDRPPYWAVKVRPAVTFTTGGVAVDASFRVLDRAGSSSLIAAIQPPSEHRSAVIEGLFACGADVGGVSGRNYAGGLATALVTGWLAGRAAATGAGSQTAPTSVSP